LAEGWRENGETTSISAPAKRRSIKGSALVGAEAENLICNYLLTSRKANRLFKLKAAGLAGPHIPNTTIRKMLCRLRRDYISTTTWAFIE
jgi:hypothetical protein